MFREKYPATWAFHRNTCRTGLNSLQPQHSDSNADPYKEYPCNPAIGLPAANIPSASFAELIYTRHSCRNFSGYALPLQQLANVLYAGYGLKQRTMLGNSEFMERPVPSGGGMYPLELYVMVRNVEGLTAGIYHYVIAPPLLELVRAIDLPTSFVSGLFLQQPYVADAPVICVATAVIDRSMKKYFDRGYRYILLEAGHCFQNMNLAAAACGLGSLNIGGFFDADMCKLLDIDIELEIPLYAMALGIATQNPAGDRVPRDRDVL